MANEFFTDGPWRREPENNIRAGDIIVAHVVKDKDGRFITQAPELWEIVEAVSKIDPDIPGGPNDDKHCLYCHAWRDYEEHEADCLIHKITAVVAKVKGTGG